MARPACEVCGIRDRAPGSRRCIECKLVKADVMVRTAAIDVRLEAMPQEFRVNRVPREDWPPGRRWCSGCQSFVRLEDCPRNGSRCKACTSSVAHGQRMQAVYGVSAREYEALFRAQGGRCYICHRYPRTKRLALDHDHFTGEPRGLLCADSERGCNHSILGTIEAVSHSQAELLEVAKRIVAYLASPPARKVLS